jgi:hypothetical protein
MRSRQIVSLKKKGPEGANKDAQTTRPLFKRYGHLTYALIKI